MVLAAVSTRTSHRLSVALSQVIVEGVADRHSAGHIAVDNIQILDGLHPEDCNGACFLLTHLVSFVVTRLLFNRGCSVFLPDPEVPTSPTTEIIILRKFTAHGNLVIGVCVVISCFCQWELLYKPFYT